jgi:hypothetical protein
MRKFAIALGIMAAVLFAGVAWKADATTWRSGTLNLPSAAKKLFTDREYCLLWMGPPLPPRFPLVLWAAPLLVRALLG